MLKLINCAAAAALLAAAGLSTSPAIAAPQDYRFELAGKPEHAGTGPSVVLVRLVHMPDGKPVPGAVVIESKADMGPAGMPTMTAPVKALKETQPGVYGFEIRPDMAGKWALTLAAKVQGEKDTVRGSVTAELAK